MTLDQAVARLHHHHADALEGHDPIRDRSNALARLAEYLNHATGEHNSPDDVGKKERFAKRVAQIGGLCLRTLVDLDITDENAPAPCPQCGK